VRRDRVRQKAAAGNDAYIAGRDQVITNQVVITNAGAAEPVVPGLLPRDVPAFTGREEELGRLASLAAGGSVVVTAIGGTAGVGKTALAVHAAHRLAPQFPDGHLYADLRGYTADQATAEPGEVLEVFLRHLGVPVEDMPAGTEERSGLLRGLLASRRVLMVLDNASSEAQVRPLLPGAGESLVLITSRSVLPGLEVDERIGLDVLAEEEATALLARLIGAERAVTEPEAMKQVREWCGRLPLALRIAGQLLAAHPAWPVARLAQMLADERDRLGQLSAGDVNVRAAFAVSYAQLADGEAKMFRLLGLHPGTDFDAGAAASLAGIDVEAAWPVLDRLVLAYLVTETAAGRFEMHDLLRLFARGICQKVDDQTTRDAAQVRLVTHYAELARFLDSCLDPQLRPAAEKAAEQAATSLPSPREAMVMFETERPGLLAALGLATQSSLDQPVEQLSESTGGWLTLLRYLDDLLIVREAALAAARHAGDLAAEGRALTNLGIVYQELRRFEEAIPCFRQDIAICRETGDRRGEGQTLNNLGLAYEGLRRFEEAVGCYEDSLVICRETGDRHVEGQVLNNLGIAFKELRRLEEAIGCYQDSLAIKRETGDRRSEGRTLNNLGNVYRDLRRFEEAIGCYQESLVICWETGDRYGEGQTLDNLGEACRDMRQPDQAAVCWRDAAAAMRDAGEYEEAGRLKQQAANVRSRRCRWRRSSWPASRGLDLYSRKPR